MVEIGDVIKFAELALVVLDYGWSPDLNASRQYREFGQDIEHLAQSLEDLTGIINTVRESFRSRRLRPPSVGFGWDPDTLHDIVGDFEGTLRECYKLVAANKSYAAASGPVTNVRWNAVVMPTVERLRRRILMHQSKIQHFLRPFEIDLHLRIHNDLVRRIDDVHGDVRSLQADVRLMLREMQALKRYFDPTSLLNSQEPPQESTKNTIPVPEKIQRELERLFQLHPDRELAAYEGPPLRDMGDAFVRNFSTASPLFEPNESRVEESGATDEQYIALLTCEFLMGKMIASSEFVRASEASHWPRYVRSLQQKLGGACRRFNQSMMADLFADGVDALPVPPIWEEEELGAYIESATLPAAMEQLIDLPLSVDDRERWKKIQLFRYCDGTDRQFRLIITAGNENQPAAETRVVDFDLTTTCLIPLYASPDEKKPLEMVLRSKNEIHRLVFLSRSDLYLFQQALTGYEVVDEYMPYRVQTIFVIGSSNQVIKEYASLQLWQPARMDGDRVENDGDVDDGDDMRGFPSRAPTMASSSWTTSSTVEKVSSRRSLPGVLRSRQSNFSTASNVTAGQNASFSTRVQQAHRLAANQPRLGERSPSSASLSSNSSSSNPTLRRRGRQGSSSAQSLNSTATSVSSTTRAVSIVGSPNVAATATLHCKPVEPMLVLFTRSLGEGLCGIVAVSLDQYVKANYDSCKCNLEPGCRITVVEAVENGRPLPVLRLGGLNGGEGQWDVLSLAEANRGARSAPAISGGRAWRRVIRVTMCFESADKRREFGGLPCGCKAGSKVWTEEKLMECLGEGQGHGGRLGLVCESFRRNMMDWYWKRYHHVHVAD